MEVAAIRNKLRFAYEDEYGDSLCCKSRYKKCRKLVKRFEKELENNPGNIRTSIRFGNVEWAIFTYGPTRTSFYSNI